MIYHVLGKKQTSVFNSELGPTRLRHNLANEI